MAREQPKQMPRRERERAQHRCEILDAAERVFVSKGYEAATVEEIAKGAEFSVGTLYQFFAGKRELYECVIERILFKHPKAFLMGM